MVIGGRGRLLRRLWRGVVRFGPGAWRLLAVVLRGSVPLGEPALGLRDDRRADPALAGSNATANAGAHVCRRTLAVVGGGGRGRDLLLGH